MEKNFIFYEKIVNGLDFEIEGQKFFSTNTYWDLVVITAISQSQKTCYEKQLEVKKRLEKFPKTLNYLIINDPDDCKIGSGGSTLNVFKILHDKYGESLFNLKILLIHAGGYSQRMPSCSVLGKIFSPVPCKSGFINDIFDLKMAIYTPFSINMKPGVFITSSDDFETFFLDEQIQASHLFGTEENDFILVAHKSPLDIAKDHGVYIADTQLLNNSFSFGFYECKTVYQKPSIERINRLNLCFDDDNLGRVAFTDSVFFFSHNITKNLLKFYDQYFEIIKKLKIEIDAYRDFLQPLGNQAQTLQEYLLTLNKTSFDQNEEEIFTNLYHLMKLKKSKILAMNESNFYHLGTINELMTSYLDISTKTAINFRRDLCFQKIKANGTNINRNLDKQGCVINSFIGSKCRLDPNSIIEYCYFCDYVSLIIRENTFLSNCIFKLNESSIKDINNWELVVPANVCIHTISIKDMENNRKYATIFFNRNDDLKKNYSLLDSVVFLGNNLNTSLIDRIQCDDKFSIWNLKFFKAYDSMSESFLNACIFIENYLQNKNSSLINYFEDKASSFYSLFDLLKYSDHENMIELRKESFLY